MLVFAFYTYLFLQGNLQSDLQEVLSHPALFRAHVGVFVKEIGGDILFEHNAEKRFTPASIVKLVTAATAWERLGPEFTPQTIIWREGKTVKILGGGDPGLTIEELRSAAKVLKISSKDTVLFDDYLFGPERYAPGWMLSDLPQSYCPYVSALSINDGKLELWAKDGKAFLLPRNFGIKVTLSFDSKTESIEFSESGRNIVVSGLKDLEEKRIAEIPLFDSGMAAAMVLHSKPLRAKGLRAPKDLSKFPHVVIRKRSVANLLEKALQESDNFYAETLLRLTGALTGKSGSWQDSLELASLKLQECEVSKEEFRLADGSGISRLNEITPRAIAKLLEKMCSSYRGERFLSCLATPGVGTLEKRLEGMKLWGKTGTLRGASNLAGILEIEKPAKRRIVFVIFVNHHAAEAETIRELQDEMVKKIYALSLSNLTPHLRTENASSAGLKPGAKVHRLPVHANAGRRLSSALRSLRETYPVDSFHSVAYKTF
ncbi:MAG TPA: D-alanyl-D-alanine carboxypeptidase/D-alanyl-D-alanine-endopeptidase [Fimbriimonadales bacterium]|nr:D-alanyl-D-alanine carboxypeptidase/D-alanyl-D-alanine-endopeptidase [Fimbriimonadales bacterium]